MTEPHPPSEKSLLAIILLARANLNVPVRLIYFFLPAISRGLGVSLGAAGTLVSVRSFTGIGAPLFGILSDRLGGHRVMVWGLTLMIMGATLVAGLPWYGTALIGFGILGASKSAYDPAMQSFVGRRVPYERRGRALGIVELSWSASLLLMPLTGWLIDRLGWRAPFGLVALLGLAAWWLTRSRLSPDPEAEKERRARAKRGQARFAVPLLTVNHFLRDPQTRLALAITVLLMLAQDNLLVVYGAWMETAFGLSLTALGFVTLVFGLAELLAELGVAFISDHLGKRRAVFVGVIGMTLGYLLLPSLTYGLGQALAGTALLILVFEFSIVGMIPIISGLNATSRGTLMSLNVAAASVGRMIAAPLGVALYRPGDLTRNGLASAASCLAILLLLSLLRERGY